MCLRPLASPSDSQRSGLYDRFPGACQRAFRVEAAREFFMSNFGNLTRRVLNRIGIDVYRYPTLHDPVVTRQRMLHFLRIDVVLDIGANIGQYGTQLRRGGFTGRIVSFEPVNTFHQQLSAIAASDGRWETRPCGLGSTDETATINVAGTLSSLLAMEDRAYGSNGIPTTSEQIQVRRLDSIRDEVLKPGERAWAKIDVQGFERQVLDGGTETLPRLRAVEMELSLKSAYQGQAGYRELIDRLAEAGYDLWSLTPTHRDPTCARLEEMDGIFVNRND